MDRRVKYTKKIIKECFFELLNEKEINKVTVSEYALQNASHTEIYGQTTGAYFSQTVSAGTLKMYTCYGGGEGRWLVFAEKVA